MIAELTTVDLIKLAIVGPLFFMLAPAAGIFLKNRPLWQRVVFAAMCFMTINGLIAPGNWGLTLGSIESYRGHTKGYHFYFNHALAIALIVAKWSEDRKSFRWLPPGWGQSSRARTSSPLAFWPVRSSCKARFHAAHW